MTECDTDVESGPTGRAAESEQAVRAAAALVPKLRENALRVDRERRLPDENIQGLTNIGFYRSLIPRKYGGRELDLPTISRVLTELGTGCASTAWVSATAVVSSWMAAHLPAAAQEEIFSTPDVRVCGSFTPLATLEKKGGSYLLNGRWPYNTGCLHAHWDLVIARDPSAPPPNQLKLCTVPMSSLQIEDDWHTYGLRGTGSCTTVASDVLVAPDKVIDVASFMAGTSEDTHSDYETPLFDLPTWPVFVITSFSVPPGIARWALELFTERVDGRPITYTTHPDQRLVSSAHLTAAQAAVQIDAAQQLIANLADEVWQMTTQGRLPDRRERQRIRANSGYSTELARGAVQIVSSESGASSIRSDCLTQLLFRDMQALSMHAGANITSMLESYGRVLLGLDPVTMFE